MRSIGSFGSIASLALAIFALSAVAVADSFDDRLRTGYSLLEDGDTEGAVATFRDLQIDQPDSEIVTYSLASAKLIQGLIDVKNEAPEDALVRLAEAKTSFDTLDMSADPFIRFNAAYNSANCAAGIAKQSSGLGKHEETVAAFEESIHAYEELLRQNPEHEGARTNLNHMRYLLKTLLQNPPPPQEQEKPGEGEDEEEKKEGEQEGEQQQPNPEEQNGEPEDQQESEDEQTAENPQDFQSAAQENQEESDPLNRQNIEAILQSLEDQDREEQKNLRRAKQPPRIMNQKWW